MSASPGRRSVVFHKTLVANSSIPGSAGVEQKRHGAQDPIVAGPQRLRGDVLGLSGSSVEAHDAAAIDDVGVEWVGCHVGVFVGPDPQPVAKRDLAAIAAAGDADGTALLLAAADPVGELILSGGHVVELRRGLVVPGAPGAAAVDRHDGSLVGHETA